MIFSWSSSGYSVNLAKAVASDTGLRDGVCVWFAGVEGISV
jgi:hypothetical protein